MSTNLLYLDHNGRVISLSKGYPRIDAAIIAANIFYSSLEDSRTRFFIIETDNGIFFARSKSPWRFIKDKRVADIKNVSLMLEAYISTTAPIIDWNGKPLYEED